MAENKDELVFVRRKAVVNEENSKRNIPAGPGVGVSAEAAKDLLRDPAYEKCKQGDGWPKASAKS